MYISPSSSPSMRERKTIDPNQIYLFNVIWDVIVKLPKRFLRANFSKAKPCLVLRLVYMSK